MSPIIHDQNAPSSTGLQKNDFTLDKKEVCKQNRKKKRRDMKKNKREQYEAPRISLRMLELTSNILVGSEVKAIKTKVESQSVEDLEEDDAWATEWDPITP